MGGLRWAGEYAAWRGDVAQHRNAQDHRQPRDQGEDAQRWLRGVLKLGERVGELRQRAARQVEQDGQGCRHPAGIGRRSGLAFSESCTKSTAGAYRARRQEIAFEAESPTALRASRRVA